MISQGGSRRKRVLAGGDAGQNVGFRLLAPKPCRMQYEVNEREAALKSEEPVGEIFAEGSLGQVRNRKETDWTVSLPPAKQCGRGFKEVCDANKQTWKSSKATSLSVLGGGAVHSCADPERLGEASIVAPYAMNMFGTSMLRSRRGVGPILSLFAIGARSRRSPQPEPGGRQSGPQTLNSRSPMRAVQDLLGHADPRTTARCAHVVDKASNNAAAAVPVWL